jgi:predicted ATPase
MIVKEVVIGNYKSFHEKQILKFGPGVNIITGQNNTGKTSLLSALSAQIENIPHRSSLTIRQPNDKPEPLSYLEIEFGIGKSEFASLLKNDLNTFSMEVSLQPPQNNPQAMLDHVCAQEELSCRVKVHGSPQRMITDGKLFGKYITSASSNEHTYTKQQNGKFVGAVGPNAVHIYIHLHNTLKARTYLFKPERYNLGESAFGGSEVLTPDARNLAEVLNSLQGNHARFDKFNNLISRILPQVKRVSVRSMGGFEVLVWSEPHQGERVDLAMPLSKCGTGVGQVLSIIYILVTSDFPRVILIDEPNSFLHPGASRALMELLKEFSQHQFIISTHSTEIITGSDPSSLHVLRTSDADDNTRFSSIVERIDKEDAKELRYVLEEVGVRLSDVFGSDRILWVEGPTEQVCFPLIVRKILKKSLGRDAIIAVKSTSDFDKKIIRIAVDVHEQIARSGALIPTTVGFIFDSERLKEDEIKKIEERSNKKVNLLPRRCFENYLIHCEALAYSLNETPTFKSNKKTAKDIKDWIDNHGQQPAFEAPNHSPFSQEWIKKVNAPRMFSELWSSLSGAKEEYVKTKNSVEIATWLVENDPNQLTEVADMLRPFWS